LAKVTKSLYICAPRKQNTEWGNDNRRPAGISCCCSTRWKAEFRVAVIPACFGTLGKNLIP
jgi:hypothetical protein